MNQFRKSLAKRQNLNESHPELKSLAHRIADLGHLSTNKTKLLDEIDQIWSDLDYIPSLSSILKRRIQSNIDELTDAVKANNHKDVEILQNAIIKDLLSA